MQVAKYKKFDNSRTFLANKNLLLNILFEHSSLSRKNMVEMTGLGPSTVTNIINDFLGKKIVVPYKQGKSTKLGGRKQQFLKLNKDCRYFIGIEVGWNAIKVVLTNIHNENKYSDLIEFSDFQDMLNRIENIIRELSTQYSNNLFGVCIGVSGIVDSEKGIIVFSRQHNIKNFNLAQYFQEKFKDISVFIENSVRMATYGEYKLLAEDNDIRNMLYIYFHKISRYGVQINSFGYGVIINGKIYRGKHKMSGEIIDDFITDYQKSVNGFYKRYKVNDLQNLLKVCAADEDDLNHIKELVIRIGQGIGQQLVYIINLLDPGFVSIGVREKSIYQLLLKGIQTALDNKLLANRRELGYNIKLLPQQNSDQECVSTGCIEYLKDKFLHSFNGD